MNLRPMAKGVLGVMFLLTGGGLSQGLTKPMPTLAQNLLAQVPLNSTGTTITVLSGEKFPQLVRRGEQSARSLLAPLFAAGAEEGYIQIGVKSRSSVFPLMDVRISRANWSRKPSSLLPYSRVFTETASLLQDSSQATTPAQAPTADKKTTEDKPASPQAKSEAKPTGTPAEPQSGQLLSSTPKADSKRVPVNTLIALSLKDLAVPDARSLGVQITPPPKGGSESLTNKAYQFTPQSRLEYSTEYTITVAGPKEKPLKEPIKVKFTTEPQYTYKKDIQAMLADTCTSCHNPNGSQRNRSELDTYEKVLKYVTPGTGGELLNPKWLALHSSGGGTGGPGTLPKASLRQRGDKVIGGGTPTADPFGTVAAPTTTGSTGLASSADSLQNSAGSSTSTDASNLSRGNRKGALTDEQATTLKTWIVQDKAIEE